MKKVLVVDDSAFMRKLITDFLSKSNQLEVIGIARNGEDAIEKIKKYHPDVVTLDVEMPKMNGIEALKKIMLENPVPVVMLSSTTKEGAEETFTAMQLGAVDFIAKPSGTISLDLHKIQDDIVEKVIAASKVQISKLTNSMNVSSPKFVTRSLVDTSENTIHQPSIDSPIFLWKTNRPKVILVGTSTGGPRALQQVLTELPAEIDAPVVVVQHMPPGFTKSLSERLNSVSTIRVKEAEHGELLQKGTVYIAPGGFHTKVVEIGTNNLAIQLTNQEPPRNGHRPSVDVLFESMGKITHYNKIAVIMTGMGSDGSQGLIHLKKYGEVKAIAESKQTCIVFGMPKAAIATNLIDTVANVEGISQSILKYLV